jgi:hypothetical protein
MSDSQSINLCDDNFVRSVINRQVGKLPDSIVNIPHREYWLHPDRHASSIGYVQFFMNWIAVALSLFAMASRLAESITTLQCHAQP